MATAQTERSNPNGANYFDDNQDTLRMVKLLKEKILVENQQGATISQALIEYEFGCIKQQRRAFVDDHDRSEKNSGQTLETSESRKQKRRAAYGNTSNELENIYKIIDEQEDEADRNPRKNNLKNILTPLQHFQTERFNCTAKHLCDALLQIPQSEIDRADRMFYSEISHRPNLNCCPTSEIVHDQVQAIRLMSFGTDQWDELETLFCKHQTFDDAYSYLQQLTQKRFEQRSLSNDSSRHCSIVRQSTSTNSNKNANVDANRQTPVNNGPRHNESRPGQAVRADSSTS